MLRCTFCTLLITLNTNSSGVFSPLSQQETTMAGEKLDITKEEMKTLTEAMKKEEFRKLLMDYAEELADPEKRKV